VAGIHRDTARDVGSRDEVLVGPAAVQVRPADRGAADIGPVDVAGIDGDEAWMLAPVTKLWLTPCRRCWSGPRSCWSTRRWPSRERRRWRPGQGEQEQHGREKGEEQARTPTGSTRRVLMTIRPARAFDLHLRTEEPIDGAGRSGPVPESPQLMFAITCLTCV